MKLVLLALALAVSLGGAVLAIRARRVLVIGPGEVGLLYRDGAFQRELPPGRHLLPYLARGIEVRRIWMQAIHANRFTVSVMTSDQFAFRMTLNPVWRVTDARVVGETQQIAGDDAHACAVPLMAYTQATALRLVAGMTLDEFLAARDGVVTQIQQAIETVVPGITVSDLLLTDLTMPPEIRRMFTETERARREGLAALERARAEQAALRALANAARSLQGNPALAQLRVLHAMESAKGAKTFVLGPATDTLATGAISQ